MRSIIIGKMEQIGLMTARKERDRLKTKLAIGLDPLAQRRIAAEEERVRLQEAQQAAVARRAAVAAKRETARRERLTFTKVANEWIEGMRKRWRDDHAGQTVQSLIDHIYPHIGDKPTDALRTSNVLGVIDNLLAAGKVETARRVRQRLGAVFDTPVLRTR